MKKAAKKTAKKAAKKTAKKAKSGVKGPRGRSSLWKGSISFGLINIPISLQTAEEHKRLHFSLLDSQGMAPIRYKRVNAESGREVPSDRIVKGYEYERGQFVIFTKKDFEAANVKATQTVDIEDFVHLDDIDPLFFEKPYYIIPQKSGEKGYALLRDALRDTGKVAIGKIVIRTRQHLAAIIPRDEYLVLEILRFSHEVKEVEEMEALEGARGKTKYSPREIQMAEQLIEDMTSSWKPDKYRDTYYDDVMKLVERKIKSGGTKEIEKPEPRERIEAPNVVDLLPLLKRSIKEQQRKRP